jgi:hypothetical protein
MTVPYIADLAVQSFADRRSSRRSDSRRRSRWLALALVVASVLVVRRFTGRGGR